MQKSSNHPLLVHAKNIKWMSIGRTTRQLTQTFEISRLLGIFTFWLLSVHCIGFDMSRRHPHREFKLTIHPHLVQRCRTGGAIAPATHKGSCPAQGWHAVYTNREPLDMINERGNFFQEILVWKSVWIHALEISQIRYEVKNTKTCDRNMSSIVICYRRCWKYGFCFRSINVVSKWWKDTDLL